MRGIRFPAHTLLIPARSLRSLAVLCSPKIRIGLVEMSNVSVFNCCSLNSASGAAQCNLNVKPRKRQVDQERLKTKLETDGGQSSQEPECCELLLNLIKFFTPFHHWDAYRTTLLWISKPQWKKLSGYIGRVHDRCSRGTEIRSQEGDDQTRGSKPMMYPNDDIKKGRNYVWSWS